MLIRTPPLKLERRRVPIGPVRANRDHHLYRYCRGLWVMTPSAFGIDLMGNRPVMSLSGTGAVLGSHLEGPSLQTENSSGGGLTATFQSGDPLYITSGAGSLFARIAVTATAPGASGQGFGLYYDSNGSPWAALGAIDRVNGSVTDGNVFWNHSGTYAGTAYGNVFAANTPRSLVFAREFGARVAAYSAGAVITSTTSNTAAPTYGTNPSVGIGYNTGLSRQSNTNVHIAAVFACELSAQDAIDLEANPYDLVESVRPWVYFQGAAGGGSYTDTITDGLTLADTPVSVLTAQAALTDGVTLGDTPAAALTAQAATSDTITLGETVIAGAAYAVALTDGVTLTDAVTGGAAFVSTITDGVTLGDAIVSASAFLGTIAETLTVGDTAAAQATLAGTLTEAITLADLPVAQLAAVGTITEPVTLGDGTAAIATMTVTLADGVTLADTITAPGASVFVVGVEFKWSSPEQPRVWAAPARNPTRH